MKKIKIGFSALIFLTGNTTDKIIYLLVSSAYKNDITNVFKTCNWWRNFVKIVSNMLVVLNCS
jgi:flagellar biosynthesis protein FliR